MFPKRWLIAVSITAAAAIRLIWLLRSPYAFLDVDISTLGLMARHILEGHFPMFFYGQYYLAPVESYIIAVFFLLFGKSPVILQLVPILIMTGTSIIIYLLGRELKNREVGFWAVLFFLFPPIQLFLRSFKSQGYIPELLFLGTLIFLLTLKIINSVSMPRKRLYYIFLGIISGIGFWTTGIIAGFIISSGIFLLFNIRKSGLLRYGYIWILAFFISGLPYWVFAIRHNFCAFDFRIPEYVSRAEVLGKFFRYDLGLLLGLGLREIIYGVIFILFLVYSLKKRERNLLLLWVFLGITLFFYTLPRYYTLAMTGTTRYITGLYVFIAFMTGYSVWWVNKRFRFGGVFLVSLILLPNFYSIIKDVPAAGFRSDRNQDIYNELVSFLKEHKIDRVVSMKKEIRILTFYSNEGIISREVGGTNFIRYDDPVERAERPAFYIPGHSSALCGAAKGFSMKKDFYYDIERFPYGYKEIMPGEWAVTSNFNNRLCRDAIDRDYSAWWSTESPKDDNMFFEIDLGSVRRVGKLQFFNSDHYRNLPKTCRIAVSQDGKRWEEVLRVEDPATFFWSGPRLYLHNYWARWELVFEPKDARFIRILQDGEEGIHPWEINELFIYEQAGTDPAGWDEDGLKNAHEFLLNKGVRFIYADFWESARIIEWGKIDALRPFNVARYNMDGDPRLIKWKKDTAFIILDSNREGWEELLKEFGIPVSSERFGRYWCYRLSGDEYLAGRCGIYWIGVTGVKIGFPLEPEDRLNIRFANGVELLGITFGSKSISAGSFVKIYYFWSLRKRPRDTSVFLYAMKEGKIVFQGDYELSNSRPKDIFTEMHRLAIPPDTPPGDYGIYAGLWLPHKGNRIYIKGTRDTKALIGRISVK